MRRLKKTIWLAIAATVLVAGAFAEGKADAAAPAAAASGPITINWMPQNDAPVDPNSPVVLELEKQLGVKLNFVYLDRSKETELLNLRIVSNDIPDVMKLTESRFRAYIDQGVLASIPEALVKEKAPKLYALISRDGGTKAWEYPKNGGNLYGIPILNPNGAYNFVPIWRDDWLKKVGVAKIPATLAEAEAAFYKFANEDPDGNGAKDTYALSNTGFSVVFGAYGGLPYFSKGGGLGFTWSVVNGKVTATATMPEMKEALTLLNKWYKDGLIDPEFISEESKGQYWGNSVTFWNGKIGFSCPGLSYHVNKPYFDGDIGSVNYPNFTKLQPAGSYDFGKPLVGPAGKSGTEKWSTYPGTYLTFGRQVAKDPAKMAKILEVLERTATDEAIYMLSRGGIKGLTYDITAAGAMVQLKPNAEAASFGVGNNGIGFMNETNFDLTKKFDPYRYGFADKVGKTGDNYTNAAWAGLESDAKYKAVVEKKIRENYMLFVIGERKLSEFDDFVADLNKAGLQQLTTEANAWYAKYNK
ncbi:MAG: hypothetical protein A2Z99_08450 [Treponema sp. GWB1_62_6]|nr:MAG: hypothetical protein A2Y36_15620 [Treponema sp. GWA1_62_8]OHE66806.1 MAG: hypothetical protein A2Z99_08450 [Treponema sp. GWB1_62_6]